jgi:HEAT repeat protein
VGIKASSSKQIESLAADLSSASAATRDAAVARLTLLGARAVERLVALATSTADAPARAGAWRTLEAIGDPRALEPALATLADARTDATVGAAAVGVARVFLLGDRGTAAIDRLTSVALDRERAGALRVAALRALRKLGVSTIAPILTSLANDPDALIREELRGSAATGRRRGKRTAADHDVELAQAAEGGLQDDPAALRRALSRTGEDFPLPLLLRIVERVREREATEPADRRDEWTMARAAAHVALANRGSRIALYDLRESLERAAAPLPVEFLAALSLVGDTSCLEAIAGAHARARNAWWRQHLTDAFHTIVARERLTRRHAVVRKIEKKWPQMTRY